MPPRFQVLRPSRKLLSTSSWFDMVRRCPVQLGYSHRLSPSVFPEGRTAPEDTYGRHRLRSYSYEDVHCGQTPIPGHSGHALRRWLACCRCGVARVVALAERITRVDAAGVDVVIRCLSPRLSK